jgi:signal peptidase II
MLGRVRDTMILLGCSGLIVAVDQWTKYLVRSQLDVGETWMPLSWLAPYARVIHWNNTGAAFGLFPSASLVFTVVALLVSVAILIYFPRVPASQWPLRSALVLQFAGALGNLIDRVVLGTVTDFISVGTFPVFNLADASISVGVAVLVAGMWLEDRRRPRDAGSPGEAGETPRPDHGLAEPPTG